MSPLSRAHQHRLLKLASGPQAASREKELRLYDDLVTWGYATSEPIGNEYGWLYTRYRITKSGQRRAASRDPQERFPASAGPWLDVYFETVRGAAQFAKGVRKIFGYRAVIDEANPRKLTTNLERWQFSELMQRMNTSHRNAPLRTEKRG